MKNLSLAKKTFIGYGVAIIILIAFSIMAINAQRTIADKYNKVYDTYTVKCIDIGNFTKNYKNLKVYYLIIHMQQMMELILQLFQSRLLRYQIHVQNSLMSLYHLFQQQIRTVRLRNRLKMYNRLLKMGRLHLNRLLHWYHRKSMLRL